MSVRVQGIRNVISGFNIANPQNIRAGQVDRAIAAAAGGQPAISLKNMQKLLAPRITNKTPPVEQLPANANSCSARRSMAHATQSGAQMTTGMYLQCLNETDRRTLTTAANTRMAQIRQERAFAINTGSIFSSEGGQIPMDRGFAEACAASASNGHIFIMRGVNKDSLGENGVLLQPDSRAPKPMTCHAKSSYFGFTKGLVPANPQFSRPDYVNTEGDKYQQALRDVKHTLGEAMAGTEEGAPLHLKVRINNEDCHVYQGTFQGSDGKTYRYQVAIPDGTDASPDEIRNRLQNQNYCKVCKDTDWKEEVTISPGIDGDLPPAEPTLVIGLPAGTGGSQHAAQERYYVSDYDVYAIAHATAAEAIDTLITQNEFLQNTWQNCGEFADNRDMAAINFVNALLLASGTADPQAAPDLQAALQQYREKYDSNHRNRPIQHAAAAAGIVKTTEAGGLEGFAVPDFPLWAVESGSVIKLENAGDLAAYMI